MRSFLVVASNGFVDCSSSFKLITECLYECKLMFEDTVDAFGNRVLIGISILGHADRDAIGLEQVCILMAGVLDATVRVVDQRSAGTVGKLRTLLQCHAHRPQRAFR